MHRKFLIIVALITALLSSCHNVKDIPYISDAQRDSAQQILTNYRSPNSFWIIITLEEIDWAEKEITVQAVVHGVSIVVIVSIWLWVVAIKEIDGLVINVPALNVAVKTIDIVRKSYASFVVEPLSNCETATE